MYNEACCRSLWLQADQLRQAAEAYEQQLQDIDAVLGGELDVEGAQELLQVLLLPPSYESSCLCCHRWLHSHEPALP
jgi:hypothetical protein